MIRKRGGASTLGKRNTTLVCGPGNPMLVLEFESLALELELKPWSIKARLRSSTKFSGSTLMDSSSPRWTWVQAWGPKIGLDGSRVSMDPSTGIVVHDFDHDGPGLGHRKSEH